MGDLNTYGATGWEGDLQPRKRRNQDPAVVGCVSGIPPGAVRSTVRYELIHAWHYYERGKADHGPTFRQWVEPLETIAVIGAHEPMRTRHMATPTELTTVNIDLCHGMVTQE
jgi:hypothetical protein